MTQKLLQHIYMRSVMPRIVIQASFLQGSQTSEHLDACPATLAVVQCSVVLECMGSLPHLQLGLCDEVQLGNCLITKFLVVSAALSSFYREIY